MIHSLWPKLAWLAAGLAIVAALWITADSAAWVIRSYSALPYYDQWEVVLDYDLLRTGRFTFHDLIKQHNEHRIVFPRLVFFADLLAFKGRNLFDLAVIFAIQLTHAALLIPLIGKQRRPLPAAARGLVVGLLLSIGQWENLLWGFQVQFVGVFALATAGFLLVARAASSQSRPAAVRSLAGASVCLFVAAFNMANGMAALPIAIALGLALRAPRWMTASLAALFALVLVLYFRGYTPVPDHSTVGYALTHLPDFIRYLGAYVGNIAGGFAGRPPGAMFSSLLRPLPVVLGLAGLAGAAAALVRTTLRRADDPVEAVLVSILAFVALTAAMTAVGRLNFGLVQAFSSRYMTPSAVFWAALTIYWVRVAQPAPVRWRVGLGVILAGLAAILIWTQLRVIPQVQEHAARLRWAQDAILSGIDDPDALAGAYPNVRSVAERTLILRRDRLSVFAGREARWMGQPLSAVAPRLAPGACIGAFDQVVIPVENPVDGARVTGWAWDRADRRLPSRVVLTNAQFKIVGLASTGVSRPDVAKAVREVRNPGSGWNGFAHVEGGLLHAFLILRPGVACEIGAKPATPASVRFTQVGPAQLGAPIPTAVAPDGSWTLNGAGPTAGPPLDAASYGSWSGADRGRGAISFGPFVSPGPTFVIGLATGPDPGAASLTLKDAQTGTVFAHLSPPRRDAWVRMRVWLPPEAMGRPLLLQGADNGAGWGQWLAMTGPHVWKPRPPAPPP